MEDQVRQVQTTDSTKEVVSLTKLGMYLISTVISLSPGPFPAFNSVAFEKLGMGLGMRLMCKVPDLLIMIVSKIQWWGQCNVNNVM